MKICAVICEFNPFHNGHKYLLQTAKKLSGADALLCVMSGNFVQRAEAAIIDKYTRTRFALMNGADIVAEIPLIYACSGAEYFAYGAISVISQFKDVEYLAFGCEDNNIALLKSIASVQCGENIHFKNNLGLFLKDGLSFATAYSKATALELENSGFDGNMCDIVLKKPNNLLAIEYLKQLIKFESEITALPVQRIGSGYNDKNMHSQLSSATAIRDKVYNNDFIDIENNIPQNCFEDFKNAVSSHLPDKKIFDSFVIAALRENDLSNLLDSGEGLEIKLKKEAIKSVDLESIILAAKSKRYTYAKIKRLCLQALFNISKDLPYSLSPVPVKLLGIKENLKKRISNFPQNTIIQNSDYDKLNSDFDEYLRIEKKAAGIYSLITNTCGDPFYGNKLIIV